MVGGSGGLIMNTAGGSGGAIGIGNFTGGDIFFGNAAVARSITIGNATSSTSIVIDSGTGGISIGNNANSGEIQIGDVTTAKTITIGNHTGTSRLFTRFGTGGLIKHQAEAESLSNANATLALSQLLVGILQGTPTANRTLTLPTAVAIVSGITGIEINDCFDFTIINQSTAVNAASFIIAMGSGGTLVGDDSVHAIANLLGTAIDSGSGTFRLRITNITASSEAYTVYRTS